MHLLQLRPFLFPFLETLFHLLDTVGLALRPLDKEGLVPITGAHVTLDALRMFNRAIRGLGMGMTTRVGWATIDTLVRLIPRTAEELTACLRFL